MSQNADSVVIIKRFFAAIENLIDRKVIRGLKTFTDKYDINRWNFISLQKEPHRDIFQIAWMAHLVNDYGVSAEWLITGRGEMFTGKILIAKREVKK